MLLYEKIDLFSGDQFLVGYNLTEIDRQEG